MDSTLLLSREDKLELLDHFNLDNKSLGTFKTDYKYKVELEKLKADEKIKFKYRSEFPTGSKIWKGNYEFYLNSVISFSRIQFDKSYTHGIMTVNYTSGRLSGGSFRIFIKKVKNKWTIDWIDLTAVA